MSANRELGKEVVFRADAAFAKPEIYEALEERGVKYAIRIPANDSLERDIAELLTRPVGRPSHKPVVELVESRLPKKVCLIKRFRIRKPLFLLGSERVELALPRPLGTKKSAKAVRVEGIWYTLLGNRTQNGNSGLLIEGKAVLYPARWHRHDDH